jgi:pimeloyl-ACP methyl ester carboxylesterase
VQLPVVPLHLVAVTKKPTRGESLMSVFVFVHGAGHGAWCWDRTERDLAAHGHASVSVELPLTGLNEDAGAVQDCLDALDGPAILVGHSYGGLVISKAAGGRSDVEQLVYVAAVLVGATEDVLSLTGAYAPTPLMGMLDYTADGSMILTPTATAECLYNETPAEEARAASRRMRPTAASGLVSSPGADPWRTIPTTYVVCERDRALSPEMQRSMATRAGRVESIDTDHSPFASRPEEFCALLVSLAKSPGT